MHTTPRDWQRACDADRIGALCIHGATGSGMSVQPSVGSVQGGTIIEVHGSGYTAGKTACIFGTSGSMLVRAEVTSSSMLSCMAPAGAEGDVALEVTGNDGADRSSDGRVFRYVRDGVAERVEPSFGPEAGGTSVTVIGRGFVSSGHLECRVGVSSASRGTWKTSSMVTCAMPARRPGNTTVEVGNTPDRIALHGAKFWYRPKMRINTIMPSSGPTSGGTIVSVHGQHLGSVSGLMCMFGSTVGSRLIVSSVEAGSCVSPEAASGLTSFSLRSSSLALAEAESPLLLAGFEYKADAIVDAVLPTIGRSSGGTEVSIFGTHLSSSPSVRCSFGGIVAPGLAVWQSSTLMTCVSPAHSSGGTVRVVLDVGDGVSRVLGGAAFSYADVPTVMRIEPSEGCASGGGTMVTVHGSGFASSISASCKLGGTSEGQARWLSSEAVSCFVGPGAATKLRMRISNDGESFSSDAVWFERHQRSQLLGVQPSQAPVQGGTVVTVSLSEYAYEASPVCAFGTAHVAGVLASRSQVVCEVPARESAGSVSLAVWRHGDGLGVGSVSTAIQFVYIVSLPVAQVLMPSSSAARGGTTVSVIGSGFDSKAQCRFGLELAASRQVSSSLVECIAPAGSAGQHMLVAISSSERSALTSNGIEFAWAEDVVVERVVPSSGSASASKVVTVHGRHFVPTEQLTCRFGGVQSALARWYSSTAIACTLPQDLSGNMSVEVSHDGLSFTESGVQYEYSPAPVVLALVPSVGHVSGGTVVSVSGRDLGLGSARAGCLFCGWASAVGRAASSTLVVCSSPAQGAGRCTVEVSTDGGLQYTSSGLEYEYRTGSVVQAISPSLGPLLGGTEVRVTGEGLSGVRAECRFGSLDVSQARLSASSTVLWCRSPARSAEGTAAVEVSVDGLPFSADGHRFLYYRPEAVVRVEPSAGSAGQPHVVRVIGEHFLDSHIVCIAGMEHKSSASWRSSTMVECTMAALPSGRVTVQVSNNGVDYSEDSARQCSDV